MTNQPEQSYEDLVNEERARRARERAEADAALDAQEVANEHERLVQIAVNDHEILEEVRRTRKIVAIKLLRAAGSYGGAFTGLLPAKNAVEDERVTRAAAVPRVWVVTDIEGERLEIYSWEGDAMRRVGEINAAFGGGFATYDMHKVYGQHQRPEHPHHDI